MYRKDMKRADKRQSIKGHEVAFKPNQASGVCDPCVIPQSRAGQPCSSPHFPYQNTYMHFAHSNRTTAGLALNANQQCLPDRPPHASVICCLQVWPPVIIVIIQPPLPPRYQLRRQLQINADVYTCALLTHFLTPSHRPACAHINFIRQGLEAPQGRNGQSGRQSQLSSD